MSECTKCRFHFKTNIFIAIFKLKVIYNLLGKIVADLQFKQLLCKTYTN